MKIIKFILISILTISVLSISEYKVIDVSQNSSSVSIRLQYTGNMTYYIKPQSPIIKNLLFTIHCLSLNDLTFKIIDSDKKRFQIPQGGVFPQDPLKNATFPLASSFFVFTYTANPFTFKIIRKSDGQIIFDTSSGNLIFSQYYMEIGTKVASNIAYGFGQRFAANFRIRAGKITVFNRDRDINVIDREQGLQTYGSFPAYIIRQNARNFHMGYFRTSNAFDVIIENIENNSYSFTYKVIGGVLDFRFFLGEKNPEVLIEKFQLYFGRSMIPPFWSLGFHQSKWGYENVQDLEDTIANYQKNDIPLDTIWSDIDYMLDYQDFTIDQQRFPLDRLNKILQNYNYVPIIDAGIKVDGFAYDEGKKKNLYIQDADGGDFYGIVWPGLTVFVDFFHPDASQYWQNMLNQLYKKIKFSGIWLDMNQPSNFCDGPCNIPQKTGFDYTNDLPYNPGAEPIESSTIPLNATHYGGLKEADVHVYFGFLQTVATCQFLISKGKRPFIISRSTTLGTKKYGFHWTGDNQPTYEYLKTSIANNFMFQFWGINMVGADICGFQGDTNQQLCARWFQLGSLYPFSRDHNSLNNTDQSPYALGPVVLESSKTNLKLRYSILKFYYRHFINKRGLGTIYRPLFIDFFQDINTFDDQISETQFMIGSQLMCAPVVQQGVTSRKVYFPQVNWYNFQTGQRYIAKSTVQISNKPNEAVPLFIREGQALLIQDTKGITKTNQLNNNFILKAGLIFDQRQSTPDVKKYSAIAGTLSIQDFHNEQKIELCINNGCEYTFLFTLTISSSGKTLQIDTLYVGLTRLNEIQKIVGVDLAYDNGRIIQNISTVEISKTSRIVIKLNNNNLLIEQ